MIPRMLPSVLGFVGRPFSAARRGILAQSRVAERGGTFRSAHCPTSRRRPVGKTQFIESPSYHSYRENYLLCEFFEK